MEPTQQPPATQTAIGFLGYHAFDDGAGTPAKASPVKVLGVDERGKIKLSRKAAMKERDEAAGNGAPAPAPTGAN